MNRKQNIRLFVRLFVKQRIVSIIIVSIITLVNSIVSLINPYLIQLAVDKYIPNKDLSSLTNLGILLVIIMVIDVVTKFLQIRLLGKIGQKVLYSVRNSLFSKLQFVKYKFYSSSSTGDLINRLTSNVDSVNSMLSEGIIRIINSLIVIIGTYILMLIMDWRLSLTLIIPLTLTALFLFLHNRFASKAISESLEAESSSSRYIQETVDSYGVIKIYNKDGWNIQKGIAISKNYNSRLVKVGILNSIVQPVLQFLALLAIFVAVIAGLIFIDKGWTTFGTVVAFLVFVRQLFQPLSTLSVVWKSILDGLAGMDRIMPIINEEVEYDKSSFVQSSDNKIHKDGDSVKSVKFESVSFGYNNEVKVLEDISFEVSAGQKLAIIGPTGSGKSTFVKLIGRLYDVDSGKVKVDGVDVRDWNLLKLREKIGYITQDTYLLEGTIRDNILYNKEMEDDEIVELLNDWGVLTFIQKFDRGLDTIVGAGGKNLSVGEKQIISILRVLIQKPEILILDEATASVDSKVESIIKSILDKISKDVIVISIAHRLSTIENSDKIIILKDKKIAEVGSPLELIKRKGLYYSMLCLSGSRV